MIMTELDSNTFFHAQSRSNSNLKNLVSRKWSMRVVHESGPREWSVVHECSPWTRSTKVVHGAGVRVLSFPKKMSPLLLVNYCE
jgi:hypothetical protein